MNKTRDDVRSSSKNEGSKSMNRKKVVNYFLDITQLLTFLAVFITGIYLFPDILSSFGIDYNALSVTELVILIHIWIGLLIGILALVHVVLHWKWIVIMTKLVVKKLKTKRLTRKNRNMTNYFINWGLVLSSVIVFITGVIKFPGFLQFLRIKPRALLPMYEINLLHDWVGLVAGVLVLVHFALHWTWVVSTTKLFVFKVKTDKNLAIRTVVPMTIGAVVILGMVVIPSIIQDNQTITEPSSVIINGIGTYGFDPKDVNTTRPDIFNEGHFSIFDILVHLSNKRSINLEYHFNNSMNTHVIESINGLEGWWYYAYYDGGWIEENVFRMDHYPYKDKMYIELFRENLDRLEEYYAVFRAEVVRKEQNVDKIIIPTVTLRIRGYSEVFNDVEVIAHNLRNDIFRKGVITAIDVIMSLSDQGNITYELQWYETIGLAEVGNYFVVKINHASSEIDNDIPHGRCGFVYEEGSLKFKGRRNHIHIPSGIRVINSPEYELWYWICL
ncbi:MAG: DUF4405 domain-containing protein [Promethearchaeota archaeon]